MSLIARLLGLLLSRPAPGRPGPPPPVLPVAPTTTTTTADADFVTWQLVQYHNAARASAGLPPLAHDARLTIRVARRFAAELAYRDTLTHDRLSGVPFDAQIGAAIGAPVPCDENAAEGQRDAAQAVADWMTSPGHRANILGPYSHMGGGVARSVGGTNYWIVDFARLP